MWHTVNSFVNYCAHAITHVWYTESQSRTKSDSMFHIPPLCQHSVATGLTFVAMADTAAVLFAVMTFPSMTLEEEKTVRKVPS